ncbi:hypothetical protein D3C74_463560 [compost metagenome]
MPHFAKPAAPVHIGGLIQFLIDPGDRRQINDGPPADILPDANEDVGDQPGDFLRQELNLL